MAHIQDHIYTCVTIDMYTHTCWVQTIQLPIQKLIKLKFFSLMASSKDPVSLGGTVCHVKKSVDASYGDTGLWKIEVGCQGFLCPIVIGRWKNYTLMPLLMKLLRVSSLSMLATPGYCKWISKHWVSYECASFFFFQCL